MGTVNDWITSFLSGTVQANSLGDAVFNLKLPFPKADAYWQRLGALDTTSSLGSLAVVAFSAAKALDELTRPFLGNANVAPIWQAAWDAIVAAFEREDATPTLICARCGWRGKAAVGETRLRIPCADCLKRTRRSPAYVLREEQYGALQRYAKTVGRHWKMRLGRDWSRAGSEHVDSDTYALLHQLRNSHGPSWLETFHFLESRGAA